MEYLTKIRDGSEKEVGNGYWFLNVIATAIKGDAMIPLTGRLYSTVA